MAVEGGPERREWIERQAGNLLLILVGVGLLGGALFFLRRPAPEPIQILYSASRKMTASSFI